MSGFTAMDDEAWDDVLAGFRLRFAGGEWSERAAALHLRVLLGDRRMGRKKPGEWPTVRELAAEWGWKAPSGQPARDRVATFLSRTRDVELRRDDGKKETITILHWQDEHRHAPLEWLRGDRMMGANKPGARKAPDGEPTGARREPDGEPTAETGERQEYETVSDGGPTATRREPDGGPTPCASSPRGSTDPLVHIPEGVSPATAHEAPTLPRWVPPRSECEGHPREALLDLVVAAKEALWEPPPAKPGKPPKPREPADPAECGTASKPVLALWRKLGAPKPWEFSRDLELVVAWARTSLDPLAENDIRGVRANGDRWGPDRSRDLTTLCVQGRWDVRLDAARRWDDAGRPTGRPPPMARGAPPGRGPPGRLAPAAERYGAARAALAARSTQGGDPAPTRPDAIDTPFSEVPP